MTTKRYQSITTTDNNLNRVQSQVANSFDSITSVPLVNGILIKDIVLSVGDNVIEHKLGRPVQGWLVVRKNAVTDIYDKQNSNNIPQLTLALDSSAIATVSLWVF